LGRPDKLVLKCVAIKVVCLTNVIKNQFNHNNVRALPSLFLQMTARAVGVKTKRAAEVLL
jgi:hypothetical protein